MADGTIRASVNPAATALGLVGLVRGIAMQYRVDPHVMSTEHVREATLALVDTGL